MFISKFGETKRQSHISSEVYTTFLRKIISRSRISQMCRAHKLCLVFVVIPPAVGFN